MSGRAVSDVVGFILIFSTVLVAVGTVSAGGFSVLTDFTDRQQVENSERGMSALGASLDTLHRSGDTYREPSLTLSSGDLFYNTTQINVTSDDPDFNDRLDAVPDDGNLSVDSLEHELDRSGEEVTVLYEAGAVFRTDSASPRYGPSIDYRTGPDGTEQAIVSVVDLRASEQISRSTAGTDQVSIRPTSLPDDSLTNSDNFQVDFRAERGDQYRVLDNDFSGELTVDASGASEPEQWSQFADDAGDGWEAEGSSGVLTSEPDTVLVRVTTIELSLTQRLPD